MNKEYTYLVSSTGDYTAMDGGLLHNKLIVIAGHNYVLVNPQELNPYFGRQYVHTLQELTSSGVDVTGSVNIVSMCVVIQ